MFVQHLRGTKNCKRSIKEGHGVADGGGGTWISQWKKMFGEELLPSMCPGCLQTKKLSGCHVCIPNSEARFICPMCKSCNEERYGEWIQIPRDFPLMELKAECKCGHLENCIPPSPSSEQLNLDDWSPHSVYYEKNQVFEGNEETGAIMGATAALVTPLMKKTEENFQSKGGMVGGYLGGSVCGVSVATVIIILIVIAIANGWNPVGWVIVLALAVFCICTCCGCCVWSTVGKTVEDSYEKM